MTIEANISRVAGWSAKLSFFAALSLSLAACGGESLSDTLGYGKSAPDEFAIVTKAPLVIPPDYSLRPPQPGAPRPQEMELQPSIGAQRALIGAEALSARANRSFFRKPAPNRPTRAFARSSMPRPVRWSSATKPSSTTSSSGRRMAPRPTNGS